MGDYQSDTLRDTLKSNWNLTGGLAKSGTSGNKGQPVYFLAHPQIPNKEHRKAVIVRKLSPLENVVTHPKFEEVNDIFEIKIYYVVGGISLATYDNSEKDAEDMADEVLRILKTVYHPLNGTGTFYRATQSWRNEDNVIEKRQVLTKTLQFTLTKIRSGKTSVFEGYGGVLAYDTSASNGDSDPVSDYTYTEAYDVQWVGGFRQIPEIIDQNSAGEHVPVWFTGGYNGRLNATMTLKKEDIGTGSHQFPTIGNPNSNGEVTDAVFLWTVTNTESTPATLTNSIKVRIISMEPLMPVEDLARIRIVGQILQPPTMTVS